MANVQHTLSGAGAPTSIPPSVGAHYTDTATGDQYQAHGTSAPEDWGPALMRQGYAEFAGAGGTFAVQPWHALIEVFGQGTVPTGAAFVLELPATPVGASRIFDVISWAIHSSNLLTFRAPGDEVLGWGGFIGEVPEGAVFEDGELVLPMGDNHAVRVYVSRLATPEVPAGELGITVAVMASSMPPGPPIG
ncbi:MAG: hypothetical protein ACK561_09985 [Pseudomonadaceae bacterium]